MTSLFPGTISLALFGKESSELFVVEDSIAAPVFLVHVPDLAVGIHEHGEGQIGQFVLARDGLIEEFDGRTLVWATAVGGVAATVALYALALAGIPLFAL